MKKIFKRVEVLVQDAARRVTRRDLTGRVVALCVGVFTGLVLLMPLVPWELPEQSASILGSGFGAALGAALAVMGANHSRKLERVEGDQQIIYALDMLLTPLVSDTRSFMAAVESDEKDDEEMLESLGLLSASLASGLSIMKRMEAHWMQLGPLHVQLIVNAEMAMENLVPLFNKIVANGLKEYRHDPGIRQSMSRELDGIESTLEWSTYFEPGER